MYSTGGIYIFSLICKRLRLYLHKVRGKRGFEYVFRPSSLYANNGPRHSSIPSRGIAKCRPIFFVSEKDSKWMIAKFKKILYRWKFEN